MCIVTPRFRRSLTRSTELMTLSDPYYQHFDFMAKPAGVRVHTLCQGHQRQAPSRLFANLAVR